MVFVLVVFVVAASFIGLVYLDAISKRVYVEKSEIDAPQITLSSKVRRNFGRIVRERRRSDFRRMMS